MRYLRFVPLDRNVSRLVLGTASLPDLGEAASFELLDEWRRLGGNALDTAQHYRRSESIIGRWLEARGCRNEIVLVTKGGHPADGRPRLTPEDLVDDVEGSLDRLGVEAIDLYLLHRDDETQPVDMLLDLVQPHHASGKILSYGASNWTTARLDQARERASADEIPGFSCSSPHLSLATQNEAPWPDCVSAADETSRHWYAETGLPLIAWSSQSAGYFAGAADTGDPDDLVVRVYESAENRERLGRAQALARERGCTANQIALAWVLHQPFPTYAVIGPRDVAQLRESVEATAIELTLDECTWLAGADGIGT